MQTLSIYCILKILGLFDFLRHCLLIFKNTNANCLTSRKQRQEKYAEQSDMESPQHLQNRETARMNSYQQVLSMFNICNI